MVYKDYIRGWPTFIDLVSSLNRLVKQRISFDELVKSADHKKTILCGGNCVIRKTCEDQNILISYFKIRRCALSCL